MLPMALTGLNPDATMQSPRRGREGVCVYYCSTYYKAVRGGVGGGWRGADLCYERLRAEASVN